MIQFLIGDDQAFEALVQQATRACVVFSQQLMPPGTAPSRARVGFEVNAEDGTARLLVDRGIEYQGSNQDIRRWFAEGEMRFHSFDRLRGWIQEDLKGCYVLTTPPSAQGALPGQSVASPAELTDLEAVMKQAPKSSGAVYIDDSELLTQMVARIRGQDEAMRLLARVICRHLARRSPRRPATVMALGPTGVGKTAAAEWLPQALRTLDPAGPGYGYLRLDMSEYQERHRISQLLGAPQGYVGYGEGAQLVDTLAANPKTIVLFDEIEKAHPDILRALMNAMDAGRLTRAAATGQSREVDCRESVFLFTSNLDATGILKEVSERRVFGSREVLDGVCRRRLRAAGVAPELVGRIGSFLVFGALTPRSRAEIVTLSVSRVAEEYGLRLVTIAPGVVTSILAACPDEGFGARPDEYLVDDMLGACFAEAARNDTLSPLMLGGPPYHCTPCKHEQTRP
jgi:hypothetical protein